MQCEVENKQSNNNLTAYILSVLIEFKVTSVKIKPC